MKKKRIAVLTATRAEYGLLKPVIAKISADDDLELLLLVTGTHLSPEFGDTYQEILEDGFPIAAKIPILEKQDTAAAVSKTMANALAEFGRYFEKQHADLLIVLGDRYETLAVCMAAMNARIPLAHIHGGEITEGAIDDAIRHAITKLSYLHFPSTERYAQRVIQLGESPDRVFAVGALGVENIKNVTLLSRQELSAAVGIDGERPYAVVTFHPVTLDGDDVEEQCKKVLRALSNFDLQYIITKANADAGGRTINRLIDEYALADDNVKAVASLGMKKYLSALKYCIMVVGNSSSGIVEAPSFHVPTVDIGDRQRGRIAAASVIHCRTEAEEIKAAMQRAMEMKDSGELASMQNPYEKDGTSARIVAVCKDFLWNEKIELKKKFYDR